MDERIKNAVLQMIVNFRKKNENLDTVTEAFLLQLVYAITCETSQLEDISAEYDEYLEHGWDKQERKEMIPSGQIQEVSESGHEAPAPADEVKKEESKKKHRSADGRCCKPVR